MSKTGDRNSNPSAHHSHDHPLDKEQFLHPQSRYRGEFTPGRLAFNANLQEFAQRVSILCNLETNGKIDSLEAYAQIKDLWRQLQQSKHEFLDEDNKIS